MMIRSHQLMEVLDQHQPLEILHECFALYRIHLAGVRLPQFVDAGIRRLRRPVGVNAVEKGLEKACEL